MTDPFADTRVVGNLCDVCGKFVAGRWTIRHETCKPPPLPAGYYAARQQLRRQLQERARHDHY
jgi:hypothetical protein